MENKYKCIICAKNYKTQQSLCNHKKRFHNPKTIILGENEYPKTIILGETEYPKTIMPENENQQSIDNIECKYCNKKFKYSQNKFRHQKKCKNDILVENEKLRKENGLI